MLVFEVVIHKFFPPLWATGHQYCIISFICHILAVCNVQISSPVRICAPICQGFSSHLSPPTRPYVFIYILPTFDCTTVFYTGGSSFPLPSSFVFTGVHPLNLLQLHPSPFLSIFPALCVLLRRSNFPFDFGGNAFFTNQRGSQPAPPSHRHTHTLPTPIPPPLLPSLPPPHALPSRSPVLAPLGPPGQRGDKGAPIISLLVLIWAAQGFQVPPITPRNIITSSQGNTVPLSHTFMHTHTCTEQIRMLADCNRLYMYSKHKPIRHKFK